MSQTKFRHSLYQEIKKLNERIDWKIVRGAVYRDEARRHRELLAQLSRLNQQPSFLTRALSFLSLF